MTWVVKCGDEYLSDNPIGEHLSTNRPAGWSKRQRDAVRFDKPDFAKWCAGQLRFGARVYRLKDRAYRQRLHDAERDMRAHAMKEGRYCYEVQLTVLASKDCAAIAGMDMGNLKTVSVDGAELGTLTSWQAEVHL